MKWWPAMSEPSARESALKGSRVVTQIFTSWNQMAAWLRQIEGLRRAG